MRNRCLLLTFFILLFLPSIIHASQLNNTNYILPYPGILPDHPLYPLKVIRDKVYDFLLRDLVKKTEFKLLMADKRFFMGIMLMDKGKPELSEQTISKGSKYFEEAVLILYKAEQEGREVSIVRHKLIDASKKYQEIITAYQKTTATHVTSGLQGSLDRVLKYQSELIESNKMQDKKESI